MGRFVAGLFALLLPAAAAGVAGLWWFNGEFHGAGPLTEESVVLIPSGTGVGDIARRLHQAGAIDNVLFFKLGAKLYGGGRSLKAGEYSVAARVSARHVLEQLIEGRVVVRRVTVPEGLMSADVVALIEGADGLVGTIEETPGEGALLPETYHFSLGDERAEIIARMVQAMDETIAELWPDRAGELPFDTPAEALVLASVVEKETSVADERAHVAGVFINRLRRGMRLQSDPTVIYGLTVENGPLERRLARDDLDHDSPYNTYVIDGLPPAPIANPGRGSIAAVLHPMETKDLYFVADGTGGHAFAATLDAHNRNVAKWRKIRREQRKKLAD